MVASPASHCSTMSWWTPSTVSQKDAHASRIASRPRTSGALPKRIVASGERCCAKRSGSIESMSAKRAAWLGTAAMSSTCRTRPVRPAVGCIGNRLALPGRAPPRRAHGGQRERGQMPAKGTIHGTHHLTFCVGTAQEDYDFHVRLLGLKSVKKTVLFDGEIPIYHLYYANGTGDASTILTAFPYRQAEWMGRRGTNQLKTLLLSVPANAIGFWADRLSAAGVETEEAERFGTHRLDFAHPTGVPYSLVGVDGDDRTPYEGAGVSAEYASRGAYGTTTSVREPEPMDYFVTQGMGGRKLGSDGANHQYEIGTHDGHGRIL